MDLKDFAALYQRLKAVSGRVETVDVDDNGHLTSITLNGFAKSGTLEVVRTEQGIVTKARYDETNHYGLFSEDPVEEALDLIVSDAWNWYTRGIDCGFKEPSPLWVEEWVKTGRLQKIQKTVYAQATH